MALFLPSWLPLTDLSAAEPAIRGLDVRGLRVGGTTTLTMDGDDFGPAPRLLLPFVAKSILKQGSTNQRAVFEVNLAGDIVPGYHQLRVTSDHGVSLPVVIGVDDLPQQPLAAAIATLPVALHGTVSGGSIVETRFQGQAKQKVLVEVEAQRLGSKLRPVVHLYNAKKLQLAWAWTTPTLFGDTRLEVILPETGTYIVTLHDSEYAAGAPGFFRLKIGAWSSIDQVFPPFIGKNTKATIELFGITPPLQIVVAAPKSSMTLPLAWPKGDAWSGPRPFLTITDYQEFVEHPAGEKLQELPQGLVSVCGRLLTPFEEDRYRVAVAPGKKVRLEIVAERIGSPLDVALVVRNDKGDVLARAEDSPGTLDPVLEYAVPDKVTTIVVGVVDAMGRGGPRGIYRLTIDPVASAGSREPLRLTTSTQRASLPQGGRIVFPVLIERRGYQGKIEITPERPLPNGVRMGGSTIPVGTDGALLTLERGDAPMETAVTTWRGRMDTGEEMPIVIKGHPLERLQPWLATEFSIAPVSARASDFLIDWRDFAVDAGLIPGSKMMLPIKVVRSDSKTTVKLTLLTSQLVPLVNNQPELNKTIRQEKPVELPANEPKGDVTVLVPVELPASLYDVTVQAELLAVDKKVLATAFAPVRTMTVRVPLIVKLDGAGRFEADHDLKKGTTLKILGKIERREGLKADVALALTGLPATVKIDTVTLKDGVSDFTLNVVLPPSLPAGEIRGLKLSGSFAPDAKQPNLRVRSREVDVTLVLKAPAK